MAPFCLPLAQSVHIANGNRRTKLYDAAQARELLLSVADSWNSGAVTAESKSGKPSAYHVNMNDNWTPISPKDTTAVAQARGVYLNVEAYRAAAAVSDPRAAGFMAATKYGVQALDGLFQKLGRGGGVVYLVNESNMTVVDDTHDGYANVHTLFAYSMAAKIFTGLDRSRAIASACKVYAFIKRELDDGTAGGLYARAGDEKNATRSLDPVVHYYEALLMFWDVLPNGWMRDYIGKEIGTMGDFIVNRCSIVEPNDANSATLVFNYKSDWTSTGVPYTCENQWSVGEWAAVGHNPEVAWLLSRGEQRGLMPAGSDWIAAGDRLIKFSEKYAIDNKGLLRYDETALNGSVLKGNPDNELYEWWPNSEAARTYVHFAITRGRREVMGPKYKPLERLLNGAMVDKKYGGWFRFVTVKGMKPEGSPKWDRWKVAYHFAMLQAEILRLDSL